jgi:phosphatidylserine decarboxylase
MAPYARLEVILTLIIGAALTALIAWLAGWWAVLPAVVALALLSFYRDPQRVIPEGNNLLVAPADGKVVDIARGYAGPDGTPHLRIMIFLSVFNVHVNRSPCAGRVLDARHKPGRFINALNPAADECNECNTLTLTPDAPLPGPVRVRQIAGVLARRIVCVAKAGDRLATGERFGMIKLGSRTELMVPEHDGWEVLVHAGQPVRGGLTVLARLRAEKA